MKSFVHPVTGKACYLGKDPFARDHRDLMLKSYIDKSALIDSGLIPALPDWQSMPTVTGALPIPDTDPEGNELSGNCVLAAPAHMVNMIGQQTGNSSLVVTRSMALAAYTKYTGYDAFTGANDNGWQVRSMLKAWKKDGLYGTKCMAFALVDWTDPDEVALATWLAGGTIGGYDLNKEIWNQVDDKGNFTWSVPSTGFGPSIGGHCMYQHGSRNWTTWGQSAVATQEWTDKRCDELWMALTDKWVLPNGVAPNGFAFADLLTDAQARSNA